MTSSNGRPARRGFLANLSAAMSPAPIPDDDTGPLVAPKSVIAAVVLSIVAGAVYLIFGALMVAQSANVVNLQRAAYQKQVADCTTQYGGIGTAHVTATTVTGTASTCQRLTVVKDTLWDSFQTYITVVGVVSAILGVLLVVAGWFLRSGSIWARRSIVGVAIITVLAALMLGVSTPVILVAVLLVMIAVVLCYLASGATYFLRVKARKHA